jgi:alcohol dehydrogenase
MKIRAAVLHETGKPAPYAQSRPLAIEEVELADPGPGEVLVRIKAAGLCHSDLSVINGDRPRPLPMVLGHEAAGIVEALGEGVDDLAVGDRVIMLFVPSCGHCLPCAEGRPALCEPAAIANAKGELLGGGSRLSSGRQAYRHHIGVSAFAEAAVVSRRSLVKTEGRLSMEEAALFGCAVVTGVGAVINTAEVRPGTTVALVGLGGVGLNAVIAARLAGARRILAIDLNRQKLELARQLGATDAFEAQDPDLVTKVREATKGGVDYAVELAGSVKAFETAYAVTRRGGTTVTAGLPHPSHSFPLPITGLVGEERTLKGSYMGSCIPQRDVPRFIELYRQGMLPVDRLMSERIGLDGINEAFDRLARGETVRQILVF